MIFDWLRRRRKAPVVSHMWKSEEQKLTAVGRTVQDAAALSRTVVLVCHFTQPFEQLSEELRRRSVPWSPVDADRPSRQVADRSPAVWLVHADQLQVEPEPGPAAAPPGEPVLIVLFDLHCLPDRLAAVRRFAANLGQACVMEQHTSVDDPMIDWMVTSHVRGMLEAFGWVDGEPMTHRFVQRAVERACAKLARRVRSDEPADSAGKWLQINCP